MLFRESVPWGWGDQWETALLARTLGKEWSGLTSWPHSKAMFSLALLSAMMVCISVPESVQKPEGTDWNKNVIGSDGRKWKVCTRPNKASHWEYLLTALPLNNWVDAKGVYLRKVISVETNLRRKIIYWSQSMIIVALLFHKTCIQSKNGSFS